MVNYVCGFYRVVEPSSERSVADTLSALHGLGRHFCPASMWVSREQQVTFELPTQFDRALVPSGYRVDGRLATIPLECANGVSLRFIESDDPGNLPASCVMSFTSDTIERNRWDIAVLLDVCKAVVGAFRPDFAEGYDEQQRARPEYDAKLFAFDLRRVPLGLFWINYYGPEWARNIGRERIERLRSALATVEWLDSGGVVVALQAAPYDESVRAHRERQRRLEELMELQELQDRFPNPGL